MPLEAAVESLAGLRGWYGVDAGVATRKVEPIVERNAIDVEDQPRPARTPTARAP